MGFMFDKVLIANRGEVALRILRACKELDIATVAVHSTADTNAMHVRLADESVCIGPPPTGKSYLNIPAILTACEITGADAVHPGYGFLSENAQFADVLEAHDIRFIGPSPALVALMGDKIAARSRMAELGLPTIPGSKGTVNSVAEGQELAERIGYPIILKAAAGGGGKGMRIVHEGSAFAAAFRASKLEAKAAFSDDRLYLEKLLIGPRHIEFQVMGDRHGNVIHLGERDCSLQRRHQKIWEESPSPAVTPTWRERLGDLAVNAMQQIGYDNAGTLEFLFDGEAFHFIEMNARLQVEHPVTEQVTGIDLVIEQIRAAAGRPLQHSQPDITLSGHAIECRINAEDPVDFLPSPGIIGTYHPPGGIGVRVDSATYSGYAIPHHYDSLIGKLIVTGRDRPHCLMRLKRALDEYVVDGVKTTLPLLRHLVAEAEITKGAYDINWLEKAIVSGRLTGP